MAEPTPAPGTPHPIVQAIASWVANDALAITFQSMGQYRSALLRHPAALPVAAPPAAPSAPTPSEVVLADICRLAGIRPDDVRAGWPQSVEAALEPMIRQAIHTGAWPLHAAPARPTPEQIARLRERAERALDDLVDYAVCECTADIMRPAPPRALYVVPPEERLRHAWECGFRLAVAYGDNHHHWDGEQRERRWRDFIAAYPLPAPEAPETPR